MSLELRGRKIKSNKTGIFFVSYFYLQLVIYTIYVKQQDPEPVKGNDLNGNKTQVSRR